MTNFPSEIHKLVEKNKAQTLRGNELSILIKANFPEFTPMHYSCRNLREYIQRYVPSIAEVGRAGADIIYGLRTSQSVPRQEAPRLMSRTDERVWKTFVSPSGFYGLYADPKTGELRVVSRTDQAPDAPWVSVPSASAEDHLEIVKDFVSKLQEPAHTVLSESLKRPRWWFGFQDETQRVGVAEQWLKFRHEKLHEKLQARLQNLGVPQPSPSPRYARQDPGGGLLVKSRTGDVAFLRKLAMTAVTKMSEDELRSLKIPLGYVIDELQS